MTRAFDAQRPVPRPLLASLVDLASRSPSAGKTQGWHLVVLEGAGTARFWDATLPASRRETFAWPGLLQAPVIALALADPSAYLDRYSEADKKATGWGEALDRWPAPYWTVDGSMAVMTLLLAAQAEGLGALFFAVDRGATELRARLGIPAGLQLLGAIAIGWPADEGDRVPGRSAGRPRHAPQEIVHYGRW